MLSSSAKCITLSVLGIVLCSSCVSNQSFNRFYKENKNHTDFAFSFPKWAAMVAIPKDEKEEVKYFTQGMRRVRVLYDGEKNGVMMRSFNSFAEDKNYNTYLIARKDGNDIGVLAKEDDGYIKEIVLDIDTEDEAIVIGILGKMPKKTFFGALEKAREADID